jgi:hypothetical protein
MGILTMVEDRPTPASVYNWRVYVSAMTASFASCMIGYTTSFIGTTVSLESFQEFDPGECGVVVPGGSFLWVHLFLWYCVLLWPTDYALDFCLDVYCGRLYYFCGYWGALGAYVCWAVYLWVRCRWMYYDCRF